LVKQISSNSSKFIAIFLFDYAAVTVSV